MSTSASRRAVITTLALSLGMLTLGIPGGDPSAAASTSTLAPSYAPGLAARPGTATTDVVYRSLSRSVLYRTFRDGVWSSAVSLGGPVVGAPSVAHTGSVLRMFARRTDGAVWKKARVGGTWSTWSRLSGAVSSGPAVVGYPDGRVDVFARSTSDALLLRVYRPGSGWSGWTSLGGKINSPPAAAVSTSGSVRACATGTDQAVWCRTRVSGSWGAWHSLGGQTYDAPAVAIEPGSGLTHVFIRSTGNALQVRTYAGGWSAWQSLGGVLVDGPGAAARASGVVDVMARGTDGALYTRMLRGTSWSGWAKAWTPAAPPAVPTSLRGRIVTRIPTTAKVVALTFDGGWDATGVASIRRTLQAKNVPATFFMTGDFVRAFPATSNVLATSGFDVGNHTNNHLHFNQIGDSTERAEVLNGRTAIFRTTGVEPKPLFRFPYGEYVSSDITLVNGLGYVAVGWTVDTLGWKGARGGITTSIVISRVLNTLRPGQIVLMHVGAAPDGTTLDAAALPTLIDRIRARGYRFVTLESLAGW